MSQREHLMDILPSCTSVAFISCCYYYFHQNIINSLSIFLFGYVGGCFKVGFMERNVTKGICPKRNERELLVYTSILFSSTAAMVLHLAHHYNKKVNGLFMCTFAFGAG
eukprot:339941_1